MVTESERDEGVIPAPAWTRAWVVLGMGWSDLVRGECCNLFRDRVRFTRPVHGGTDGRPWAANQLAIHR